MNVHGSKEAYVHVVMAAFHEGVSLFTLPDLLYCLTKLFSFLVNFILLSFVLYVGCTDAFCICELS